MAPFRFVMEYVLVGAYTLLVTYSQMEESASYNLALEVGYNSAVRKAAEE
jgi:hypothetical protein